MALLNPYASTDRPAPGATLTVDEGTFFDLEADTIHVSIGVSVDMPLLRTYVGPGGQTTTAAANTWPLEYDGAGLPIGRRVMSVHRDADGAYGVYNAVAFASLSWFTSSGTLLIGVTPLDETSTFARVLELSSGTPAERLCVLRHGASCILRVETGNQQVVRLGGGALTANQYNKIAIGYGPNDWRLSVNGGAEVIATSGGVPVVTQGHIGGLRGIASNMLMHNIRHWADVKANLKGLSAL